MSDSGKEKKPKYNMWQNLLYMLRKAWKVNKKVIWVVLTIGVVKASLTVTRLLVTPVILKKVEQAESFSSLIGAILLFSGLLIIFSSLIGYFIANKIFGRIDVRSSIIYDLTTKFSDTSYENILDTDFMAAHLKARSATNGNRDATEHIWETLQELISNILGFVVFLFIVSGLDLRLMAVVVLTTGISYLISKRIDETAIDPEYENNLYMEMDYLMKKATDRALAKDIRIFGLKNWVDELSFKAEKAYREYLLGCQKKRFVGNICDVILTFLRNGIAYAILIKMTLDKGLSASEFLLYFGAIGGFTEWVKGILEGFLTFHKESIDISRVREFIEWEEPFKFEDGKPLDTDSFDKYEITLENVSYKYPEAKEFTIKNLNLTIKPGEKLAIVGLNGAGKTTLIKLVCGLLDPTEGCVLLNGEDIRNYNRRDYYKLFSAVFQDFSVLAGSISENVAQRKDDFDEDRIKDCIEKAGLEEKIVEFPEGYNTKVGRDVYEEGVDLSGGQMQRLMLARALYKDGPILTLDEPTAALDPIAENDIYLKYNDMARGKTSIFISHRLASTRFCDRIILLLNGQIVEEGSHEELMNKGGKYADLFEVQSKYYKEGGEVDGYEEDKVC